MELWFTENHTEHVKFSIQVDKQLYTSQSEFQRIDIFESKEFGRFLTLDSQNADKHRGFGAFGEE